MTLFPPSWAGCCACGEIALGSGGPGGLVSAFAGAFAGALVVGLLAARSAARSAAWGARRVVGLLGWSVLGGGPLGAATPAVGMFSVDRVWRGDVGIEEWCMDIM